MKKINISPWVQRFSEIYLKKYKSTKKIKVLDLACGSGRHSRYFIKKKLSVFSVDKNISEIRDLQTRSNISIIEADIEKTDPWSHPLALKGKKFNLIVVTNYLFRPLFPSIIKNLKKNGMLIYETFSEGNEKYGHPKNLDFLLKSGELLKIVEKKLHVIAFEEGYIENPKKAVVQRICAKKIIKSKPQKFIDHLH